MSDDQPTRLASGDWKLALKEGPNDRFVPKKFYWRRLTCTGLTSGRPSEFDFSAKAMKTLEIQPGFDIRKAASDIAKGVYPPDASFTLRTPFDIEVDRQSYVVIELDPDINWRFTPKSNALTHEVAHGDDDFGVQIFDTAGSNRGDSVPEDRDCRVLYFCLKRRLGWEKHKFNFYVDLLQGAQGSPGSKCMPTVFDPDIGNNGGSVIPP